MQKRGFALVVALALMAVLMLVVTALAVLTTGELRQSKSSTQLLQARAAAEAGDAYADYVLKSQAQAAFAQILAPYNNDFVRQGGDLSQWVIPPNKWNTIAQQFASVLNQSFGNLPSNALTNGAQASIRYSVSDFRGVTKTPTSQTYQAIYKVVSTGQANGGRRRVESRGVLQITVGRPSLSQWLFLVEDAGGRNGFFPTGSVFNGPVHANHNWGFWGRPIFNDVISTADDGAYYWSLGNDGCDGWGPEWVEGDSRPPCTVPVFRKGFLRNAPEIQLPTTAVSQERAALGLDPDQDDDHDGRPDPVTTQERCQALFGTNSCSVPKGVYVPHRAGQVAGGIYVKGTVKKLTLKASGDGRQIYDFQQYINGRLYRWVITTDYNNNQTTVKKYRRRYRRWNLVESHTYAGVLNGPAPVNGGGPTGQIYVAGSIRKVSGPPRSGPMPCGTAYPGDADNCPDHPPPDAVAPALSRETQLNITARYGIGISGDLTYECDPTAVHDANYRQTHPRCAINQPLRTVLGMMSEQDNITILEGAPDNIYLWGSYLSGAPGKGLAVENYDGRGPQGKMRLFGGLIQSSDKLRGRVYGDGSLASGYIETFDYDRRFANSGLTPPNFPTARYFGNPKVVPVPLSYKEY